MKICRKCEQRYTDSSIFCGNCHSILYIEESNLKSSGSTSETQSVYTDWNPPAATTLYSKIKNIPYRSLKYDLNRGFQPNGLRGIESKLDSHKYHCAVCSYFNECMDNYCTYKKIKVDATAICKMFEPKP